jgi:SAM-dependent methyltransferase
VNSNFRTEFYKKYNSTFKVHITDFDKKSIEEAWKWYDFKYLPLLKKFPASSAILELGCGRGYMLEYLMKHGYNNLKGVDISEEQIKLASAKGFDVTVSDALGYLRNSEDKFKIIIALDFVEHFYKEELIPLFKKIYDNLDQGGIFIFHTPNGQSIISPKLIYGDLTHLTIFTPNSALQLLKLIGFDSITFFETGPAPKNFIGIVRLILWKMLKLVFNFLRLVESGTKEKILTQNFICVAVKK